MKTENNLDFSAFQSKLIRRFCENALLSAVVVLALYLFLWKQRGGNMVVGVMKNFLGMDDITALRMYQMLFRNHKEMFFAAGMIIVFFFLLWSLFRWIIRYFKEVHQGIGELLKDNTEIIHLSPEMLPFEHKLNAVKYTLEKRREETIQAEQRKNELVMYLAHDIRTPLTSVIGYLNLLREESDMCVSQRVKYLDITLGKAERLGKMIEEFFEITRYNSQQIQLKRTSIDLYYMLIQLTDELSPVLTSHGNQVVLQIDEELTVYADSDKLARVFGNILKNAAAYSHRDTEILISGKQSEGQVEISFKNEGETVPEDKLTMFFRKFYRLDESRESCTGGTGLGLAIAREIITLHGGTIRAESRDNTITFCVTLPAE